MIVFTEKATNKIKEIRKEENIPDTQGLRIGVRGGGCNGFSFNLCFDSLKDLDTRHDCGGIDVFIDPMSALYLEGTTVDYIDGLNGSGFKFNSGKVTSTCGCGSSVSF